MTANNVLGPMVLKTTRIVTPVTPVDPWVGISHEGTGAADYICWHHPTQHCLIAPGVVSAGALYMLSDTGLGWLALNAVPEDRFIVTSYMHVDVVVSPAPDAVLRVRDGKVVRLDENGATCTGVIVDENQGQVVAITTARFASVPVAGRNAGKVTGSEPTAPATSCPRVTESSIPIVNDPVSQFLKLGLVSHVDDELTYVAKAGAILANDRGGLHGGMGGMLGEHVALVALNQVRPDVAYRGVESRAVFLRPIECQGDDIWCRVRVLQHGRRQAVVTTSLLDAQGRVAVEIGSVYSRV